MDMNRSRRIATGARVSTLPLIACAAAAGSGSVNANPFDPAFSAMADVFVSAPKEATAVPGCKIAQDYVTLIRSGRYTEVVHLFEPDAMLMEPVRGPPRIGAEAIAEFYGTIIAKAKPFVMPVSYAANGKECFLELAVRMPVNNEPRFVLVSVNHFTVSPAGKIARMIAFSRPLGAALNAPKLDERK